MCFSNKNPTSKAYILKSFVWLIIKTLHFESFSILRYLVPKIHNTHNTLCNTKMDIFILKNLNAIHHFAITYKGKTFFSKPILPLERQ